MCIQNIENIIDINATNYKMCTLHLAKIVHLRALSARKLRLDISRSFSDTRKLLVEIAIINSERMALRQDKLTSRARFTSNWIKFAIPAKLLFPFLSVILDPDAPAKRFEHELTTLSANDEIDENSDRRRSTQREFLCSPFMMTV